MTASIRRSSKDSEPEQDEPGAVIQIKRKEPQIPPPEHSPFEIIQGLDQRNLSRLYLNKNNKYLLPEGSEMEADKMMTKDQYQTLFKSLDLTDANISLKKFI